MRSKYIIEITETLQKQIAVFAESEGRALDIVKRKYDNADIVLDCSDFIDYEINSLITTRGTVL